MAEAKHTEQLKTTEAKHAEQLNKVEGKHAEELQRAKANITKLEEELKKKANFVAKIIASKDKYKEASLINYLEGHKLQSELEISRKEVADLEEANTRNLEKYEGAAFQCFYIIWKSNPMDDFTYLPNPIREAELAKCAACLEKGEKAQGSPEISLAIGIEGVNEDAGATVFEQPQEPQ
ncbi:uncharacterized protein LOC133782220 [Humulus lupulus]|uniref:uncharacterized protein LOC133782220 n=1 Tax=Humulus lupulus TaxID=3486 RepID=UPI002B4083E1|nr:uncharacterized protein LOC133782220 [Humulus lupulus]